VPPVQTDVRGREQLLEDVRRVAQEICAAGSGRVDECAKMSRSEGEREGGVSWSSNNREGWYIVIVIPALVGPMQQHPEEVVAKRTHNDQNCWHAESA
jgi:hypothetical protein